MEHKRWFDKKEVCAILNMGDRQFRDLIERGLLPRGKVRGKKHIWSREDIEAMVWLENHRHRLKATPKPVIPPKEKE